MASRILHLVRHGQYTSDPVESLTDQGRAQAVVLRARLAGLPPPAVIHVSTAPRALETAELLRTAFPDAPVRVARTLVEGIFSRPRFPLPTHLAERDPRDWDRAEARLHRVARRYVRRVRGEDRTEWIVAHGNLIRALVCRAIDVPLAAWWQMQIHHCSLTTLAVPWRYPPRIVRFNDHGHLPQALVSE